MSGPCWPGQDPRLGRLDHVVVGSGLQAGHDVEVVAAGGQHDHRGVADAAQPSAHLKTVYAWQHHIEHDDIHRTLTQAVHRRLTGRGGAHAIAEPA